LGIDLLRHDHDRERRTEIARKPVFFLSYHTADRTWAEWIAAIADQAGCRVVRQSWPFAADEDLAARARESRAGTDRIIVLLSSAFLASPCARDGWLRELLTPGHHPLHVVKVEACDVPHRISVDVDLTGRSASTAASLVLAAIGADPERSVNDGQIGRKFPGNGPSVTNIPASNANFTDRVDILAELHRTLLAEASGEIKAYVLHGFPGVGKTQTVIEFAHRFAGHYDVIWWIRAEQTLSITDQLTMLALELGIDDLREHERMINALWQELGRRDRWLLIYDNATTPQSIASYWPPTKTGDVLVTSRHPAWRGYGVTDAAQVQPFTLKDAVTFLRKRSHAPDERSAAEVADALGYLPLALEQAAAYVEETQTSLEKYRQLLTEDRPGLLGAGHPQRYEETVATTWAVSVAAACQDQPHARDLLAILAFLAPDDIPRDLIHKHASVLDSPLREIAGDPVTWDLLLGSLIGYSLVTADPEQVTVHRLFQQATRHQLTPGERTSFRAQAVRLLAAAFPDDSRDRASWPACGRLLPHVSRLARGAPSEELGDLLHRAGRYLHRRGDYPQALWFLERALKIRTAAPDGTSAVLEAETLTALARVYYHTADLTKALECTERALELFDAADGEGSSRVLENKIHLSRVLREVGEFARAEQVADELVADAPPGPLQAAARQAHGDALWRLGELEQAQAEYRTVLAMRQSMSADPLDLATCHKHLGIISADLDDLDTAERELRSARALLLQDDDDEDAPDVIDVDNHLADVLRRTGHPREAMCLLERVIKVRERLVGEHPDLAGSLQRYGAALAADDKESAWVDALERSVAMFAERMGPRHTYVAEASVVFAEVLRDAGRLDEAIGRAETAVSIYADAYGDGHRATQKARALLDALERQRADDDG
jgi:tetratricopeptide (TPR) repeat protein